MCSWEKEHISSEALEAARIAANKYMVKVSSLATAWVFLRKMLVGGYAHCVRGVW